MLWLIGLVIITIILYRLVGYDLINKDVFFYDTYFQIIHRIFVIGTFLFISFLAFGIRSIILKFNNKYLSSCFIISNGLLIIFTTTIIREFSKLEVIGWTIYPPLTVAPKGQPIEISDKLNILNNSLIGFELFLVFTIILSCIKSGKNWKKHST